MSHKGPTSYSADKLTSFWCHHWLPSSFSVLAQPDPRYNPSCLMAWSFFAILAQLDSSYHPPSLPLLPSFLSFLHLSFHETLCFLSNLGRPAFLGSLIAEHNLKFLSGLLALMVSMEKFEPTEIPRGYCLRQRLVCHQ